MTVPVHRVCAALALLGCISLGGCLPSMQSRLDEEKEPHFLAGKNRFNAMDYQGAFESFEKALEVNPGSAAAHFELACLCVEADPAAAIYHYERYLKLRPHAENNEIVRTRILARKQELARAVSLAPVAQSLQDQFEKLREANQQLREELQTWRAYALRLQALTNASAAPAAARAVQTGAPAIKDRPEAAHSPPPTVPVVPADTRA